MDLHFGTIEAILGIVAFVFGAGAAWANLRSAVQNIERTIAEEVRPVLNELRDRVAVVENRVGSLWQDKVAPARSRRRLNRRGLVILAQSGIREMIDERKFDLERLLNARNSQNAYDRENAAIQVVAELRRHFPQLEARLKEAAFKVGIDVDLLLYVGGIYFRDQLLKEHGFLHGAARCATDDTVVEPI